MTDKDDEIVALLRELVQLTKDNSTRSADAIKWTRRSVVISRIIVIVFTVVILATFYFR
jgi:hypothetical protein